MVSAITDTKLSHNISTSTLKCSHWALFYFFNNFAPFGGFTSPLPLPKIVRFSSPIPNLILLFLAF